MDNKKEIRAGTFRISCMLLIHFIGKLFTGEAKLVNKNLHLRSIRRVDGDIPMLDTYYDFFFLGDDLPLVEEGMYPCFVMREPVEGTENSYRLVPDIYLNKHE